MAALLGINVDPKATMGSLPIGLQLMAAANAEETLFAAAAAFEANRPALPRPPGYVS